MNTQAHAIVNAFILQKLWKDSKKKSKVLGAIIWGSIIPDIPMVVFFFWYVIQETPPDDYLA